MKRSAILAAAAVLGASGAASAVPLELFIDVNTLSASFSGTWDTGGGAGVSATGSVSITTNMLSSLNDVRIDGVTQAISASLTTFTATINLVNGGVTGGSISTSNSDGTSYTALIRNGFGDVSVQSGQGWSIDGLTFDGFFANASYAGVDVTPWFNAQPDNGSFLNFAFNPGANGTGTDNNTDVDLYVLVPMPAAAGLGLAGLAGLGIRRRR